MVRSRERDCRLAILRVLIEAWEEVVDRNLSWFNQLVSNSGFEWAVGLAEMWKHPHPSPLPKGEGAYLRLWAGTVLIPLLFAKASPLVQAARQDAERAALGHGRPIGACRWTRVGAEGTRRQSGE
jgi:hypothetical protein